MPKGRVKGVPNKKPYTVSAAVIAQRQSAVMTRQRVRNGKSIKDTGGLKYLDELTDGDEELKKIYRGHVADILSNPLTSLAKDYAELKIRAVKFERKNKLEGEDMPLHPLLLKAIEIELKATKIYVDGMKLMQKRGNARRVDRSSHDDLSFDAEWSPTPEPKQEDQS